MIITTTMQRTIITTRSVRKATAITTRKTTTILKLIEKTSISITKRKWKNINSYITIH